MGGIVRTIRRAVGSVTGSNKAKKQAAAAAAQQQAAAAKAQAEAEAKAKADAAMKAQQQVEVVDAASPADVTYSGGARYGRQKRKERKKAAPL